MLKVKGLFNAYCYFWNNVINLENSLYSKFATILLYYYQEISLTELSSMEVLTMYLLPKFHRSPYKYRFISSSSNYSTTIFLFTSALNTIKKSYCIFFCNKAYENSGINYFGVLKKPA